MRLIVSFQVSDGYTYFVKTSVPVVYESAEAFLCDLEKFIKDKVTTECYENFILGGTEFSVDDFIDNQGEVCLPDVLTVDEWFKAVEA